MRKNLGNIVITLIVLTTVNLWLLALDDIGSLADTPWKTLSKSFALIGTTLLALTFVLATRLKFLEFFFGGLDKVYKVHHIIGGLAFTLITLHPVLLIVENTSSPEFAQKLIIPGGSTMLNMGIVSLYLFAALIVFTIFVKMPYELWKLTHIAMGIPFLLAAFHIYLVKGIVVNDLYLKVWLFALIFIGIFSAVFKRFFYSFSSHAYDYEVTEIETFGDNDVTQIVIKPILPDQAIKYDPADYFFISFESDAVSSEPHPFGVSNYATDGTIRLSIKNLGDYTAKVKDLKIGDKAKVYGNYGVFADRYLSNKRDNIWIGGGAGVVPILSLLDHYDEGGLKHKVWIYYATIKESEAYYDEEFKEKVSKLKDVSYQTFPEETKGFLTADLLEKETGDLMDKDIYVCGPPGMMKALKAQFLAKGLPEDQIIMEEFSMR